MTRKKAKNVFFSTPRLLAERSFSIHSNANGTHYKVVMDPSSDPTVIAVFAALGTLVGYLGTEVASASIFDRLLWPTRYYSSACPTSLMWMALMMPMGGPIHKAAVEALDRLVAAGLWRGYCRGDMLGTVFYKNRGYKYVVHPAGATGRELKDARDAFWITVLELVPWPHQVPPPLEPNWRQDSLAAAQRVKKVLAQRPFFELELTREEAAGAAVHGTGRPVGHPLPILTGDNNQLKLTHILGILASESISVVFGVATAVTWKSPFAAWYFVPLLLKLGSLLSRVGRQPVKGPEDMDSPGDDGELTLFEVADYSKGFFLITGPRHLVYQFWHHYGHPVRNNPGLHWDKTASLSENINNLIGDRTREVLSMLTVIAFIFVYPAGLITFLFASSGIQWVWLGYQLIAMAGMHVYRFFGGEHRGSTQERLANELSCQGLVCFDDGSEHRLLARLQTDVVDSVAAGRGRLSYRIAEFLATHTRHDTHTTEQ
ncbi:unnamed protein product [Clonostachys rhizophaga]|uniref:Uncharacterized protein n=1 Tax=Clonostachys rhizophaga TaxID=160324 RepID=A0A9N9YKS3_9HYPO|nr:unnamed protein product [Clonostachys rhizophaga]